MAGVLKCRLRFVYPESFNPDTCRFCNPEPGHPWAIYCPKWTHVLAGQDTTIHETTVQVATA